VSSAHTKDKQKAFSSRKELFQCISEMAKRVKSLSQRYIFCPQESLENIVSVVASLADWLNPIRTAPAAGIKVIPLISS
jgi:hypothetical protein